MESIGTTKQKNEKRRPDYRLTNWLAFGGIVLGLILIATIYFVDRQLVYGDILNGKALQLKNFSYLIFGQPIPKITPIPSFVPSDEPSEAPSDTQVQSSNYQTVSNTNPTSQYQNYGWYEHNGQSMQYVNGNWYATPQQNTQPAQTQNNDTSNNYTIPNPIFPTPIPGVPLVSCQTSAGTFQLTQDQCTQAQQQDQQTQSQETHTKCVEAAEFQYNALTICGPMDSYTQSCYATTSQEEQQAVAACP